MADLTPEALAAEWDEQAKAAALAGLHGRRAELTLAAKEIRDRLAPAHAALTAERDRYRDGLEAIARGHPLCGCEVAREALEGGHG